MSRDFSPSELSKRAKAKRQAALSRPEMLQPATPRVNADGPMSMAVKVMPAEDRALIDAALANRAKLIRGGSGN